MDTQFVFPEQSFIPFFNKISNISCDDVVNINSIVGLRNFNLHKRDFSDLLLYKNKHKILNLTLNLL